MKKNLKFIPVSFLIIFARLVPFNWIVGSLHATFSLSTMIAPVIAEQYGLAWISLLFISKGLFSISLLSISSVCLFIAHRLPLLFASRAFQKREFATSILLPSVCMALFSYHEVGRVAWIYSLYWLIPMALFFTKDRQLSRALSASFVAHAVGSVVWLYTCSIPAPVWLGLIPVVFLERLLIASGILFCSYFVTYVSVAMKRSKQWLSVATLIGRA